MELNLHANVYVYVCVFYIAVDDYFNPDQWWDELTPPQSDVTHGRTLDSFEEIKVVPSVTAELFSHYTTKTLFLIFLIMFNSLV